MIDGKNGFGQQVKNDLTVIWVGFLEVHFKMGWGEVKLPLPLHSLSETRQNYAGNFKFDT